MVPRQLLLHWIDVKTQAEPAQLAVFLLDCAVELVNVRCDATTLALATDKRIGP